MENFNNNLLSGLKLLIIPTKSCPLEAVPLHNSLFSLWKQVWIQTYSQINNEAGFSPSSFYSTKDIICIYDTLNERPIALMLGRKFNLLLESHTEHEYFKFYHPKFISNLTKKNIINIYSLESCSVQPSYQNTKSNISFGEIMMVLSALYAETLSQDAVIASIRADYKLHDKITSRLNYKRDYKDLHAKNFILDNIYIEPNNLNIDNFENLLLIKRLWKERVDFNNQQEDIILDAFTNEKRAN